MSAPSISRIKERGGSGGKVAAPRPSDKVSDSSGDAAKKLAGKENPRSRSRVSEAQQKPVLRAMPRISKPAPEAAETHVRKSASSVPRGRSCSPSDFSRMLSDLRRQKGSVDPSDKVFVSRNGHLGLSGSRVSGKFQQKRSVNDADDAKVGEGTLNGGVRVLRDSKDPVDFSVKSDKARALEPEGKGERSVTYAGVLGSGREASLKPSSENVGGEGIRDVSSNKGDELAFDVKVGKSARTEGESESKFSQNLEHTAKKVTLGSVGDLGFKDQRSFDKSKVSEGLKEKSLNGGVGAQIGSKYPSKLHEKLAFLEGKVKRIASDIKRTKEMLDMNDPNASKVVLLDIQAKITGIEKAMGNVTSNPDGTLNSSTTMGNIDTRTITDEKSQSSQLEDVKNLVKGMNSLELEAKLFPHHKLLRNRILLKAASALPSHPSVSVVSGSDSKAEGKPLNPIDEIPIAMEFLHSLDREQSKISTRDEPFSLDVNEIQEMDEITTSEGQGSSNTFDAKLSTEMILTTDETIDQFDDNENQQALMFNEGTEDTRPYQLNEIGRKTSTGGWFVSEGESVLLAHDDGSCSFYDITNNEEKSEYKPPAGVSPNVWRDCWIVRAPGVDGCSGRYVVAASAGNTMDAGFCSWDFYTKDVQAFYIEDGSGTTSSSRKVLGPLSNAPVYRKNSTILSPGNQQWWYKPCGPLIISTASCQRVVRIYDIRDGEQVMKWEVQKPVLPMEYSSPLQWRNRGKVVIAEAEVISLFDVNSLNPQALLSVPLNGQKISALHVNNTDAELGGGVRQRASSSEAEGNDGVFFTPDSINVLDFRNPSGVGLKISKLGVSAQSVYSRGDSIFLGCTNVRSGGKKQSCSQVQQFSLRKQKLVSTYVLPESNAHSHYTTITQVWGNSNIVMGVCGLGLFVFDALNEDNLSITDYGNLQKVSEVIGPDDLYSPSFDYASSRALLISRDRPALWKQLH